MAYPSTLDTISDFWNPAGTTLLSTGHSQDHRELATTIVSIENVLGTTAGTSVLGGFAAGNFAVKRDVNYNVLGSGGTTVVNLTDNGGTNHLVIENGANGAEVRANNNGTGISNLYLSSSGRGTIIFADNDGGNVTGKFLGIANGNTYVTFQNGVGTPGGSIAVASDSVSHANLNLSALGTAGTIDIQTKVQLEKAIYPKVTTMTDAAAGTIETDAINGQLYSLSLGTTAGNRTLSNPTNSVDGQLITYRMKQNAAATGTIVWGSNFRFDSATGTATLGTAATWNYYGFRYNSGDTKWDYLGGNTNII